MATAQSEPVYIDLSDHIRDLTEQEIAEYREQGWLLAPGFVSEELCGEVLQHYKDWSGIRWDEWPEDPAEQKEFMEVIERATTGKRLFAARQDDPWMFNYVTQKKIGKAAAQLLGVKSVRALSETLQAKLPQSSGHGVPLEWHQDGPFLPIDRSKAVQFWLALVPITTAMGPMVHLTGSHREPLGGMLSYSGEKPREVYPDLWDRYEETEPHDLKAGDAMFHDSQCWHASGYNMTDKVRWGMSSYRMSADCMYTGQQNYNTDGLGLEPNKTFDHPNFPVVYP